MENIISEVEAAEIFLEILNANKVDYIFLNPGTDTFPVQEALAKFETLGKQAPQLILCLHESFGMATAHGYFMVSGRPQVVLVHTDLGTQQVGGALHNAQRGRAGIILCAGRAPVALNPNKRGGRHHPIHWLQEQFDQAGIVRGYVKWHYELRSSEDIPSIVQRAFQVATTEPSGPVYLILPPDLLLEKTKDVPLPEVSRYTAAATPQGDMVLLERAAEMLAEAENPLIIVGYSGRHPDSVASLVELAETLGAPVVTSQLRMNFPSAHPLRCNLDIAYYLKEADVILVIDCDVPFVPGRQDPQPGSKVVYIDIDPIKQNLPTWVFPSDIHITADSSKALPVLNDMVYRRMTKELSTKWQNRSQRLQSKHNKQRAELQKLALDTAAQNPISREWLGHCISEAIDEDAIILHETAPAVGRNKPGTLFQSGGSSLGWGLGAALGAKLAAPDKTVLALVGDGSFIFGCPVAALWAASTYKAAFLCVIFNNKRYTAPKAALIETYQGESFSEKMELWKGIDISPPPNYALIAESCHAFGETVIEPSEVKPALERALAQVRSGKPAVLDVHIQ